MQFLSLMILSWLSCLRDTLVLIVHPNLTMLQDQSRELNSLKTGFELKTSNLKQFCQ